MPALLECALARTVEQITAPPRASAGLPWTRVMDVAEKLPAALTDCLYLEQWLRGNRLDFIVRVREDGRDLLAGDRLTPNGALRHALRTSAAWRRVDAALQRWRMDHAAWRAVHALWLEFDLDGAPRNGGLPEPRVFVDFTAAAADQTCVTERYRLAMDVLRPLLGETSVMRRNARMLRHLFASLRPGSRLISVGVGHDARTIRACIAGLGGTRLTEYLAAVRWPGSLDDLDQRVLSALADAPPIALLHLDVADAVQPRIGLEYLLDRRSQLRGVLREHAFVDRLVEHGLCDDAQSATLHAWGRQWTALLPHAIWYSRVVRRVNHVKLVYGGGEAIAAKAYLCCFHRLISGTPVAKE